MSKRRPIRQHIPLRPLKPGYFLVAFVAFGILFLYSARANNLHMTVLRDAVYSADENNGDVELALVNLRNYVTTHMNTSLTTKNGVYPPIQLKYTYDRLVQAAGQASTNANEDVYTAAQKACEQQIPTGFSGRYRLQCIEQYVSTHGGGSPTTIPDSLYKYDFVSPTLSLDRAGLSLLAAVISLVMFFGLIASRIIIKKLDDEL